MPGRTRPPFTSARTPGGRGSKPGTLQNISGYDTWTYPLPPHTPHVMWFAAHPQDRSRLLAGIEVGGLVHTADGGRSWSLVGEGINPDIHGLAIAPSQPEVVWAATPAGIYRSEDDGTHFRECNAGLPRRYARPIAVDCADDRVAYTVVTHTARGFFGIPAAETGGLSAGRPTPVSRGRSCKEGCLIRSPALPLSPPISRCPTASIWHDGRGDLRERGLRYLVVHPRHGPPGDPTLCPLHQCQLADAVWKQLNQSHPSFRCMTEMAVALPGRFSHTHGARPVILRRAIRGSNRCHRTNCSVMTCFIQSSVRNPATAA